MVYELGIIHEQAACITGQGLCNGEEALFMDESRTMESVALCQRCPVQEECAEHIGSVALAATRNLDYFEKKTMHMRVIAGRIIRWGAEPQVTEAEGGLPIADGEPALQLAGIRKQLRADTDYRIRRKASNIEHGVIESASTILEARDGGTALRETAGKEYRTGWRQLYNAAYHCGHLGADFLFRQPAESLADLAGLYFEDLMRFKSMGIKRPATLAIRQSPDDIEALYVTYANHPNITPSLINHYAQSNPVSPERAIRGFNARTEFFRDHFPKLAALPSSYFRLICRNTVRLDSCWARLKSESDNVHKLLRDVSKLQPLSLDASHPLTGTELGTNLVDRGAEEQRNDQEEIIERLAHLPPLHRAAVARVYGLEWLLTRHSPGLAELEAHFNTDCLEDYVNLEIIPGLG